MTYLAYWGAAWLAGVWLGSRLALPFYAWGAGALLALLVALLARSLETRRLLLCAVALALGATRLVLAQPHFDEHALKTFNDREVTLVGTVAGEPDVRDVYVFYKLDAETLSSDKSEGEPLAVHGAVRLRGPRYPVYAYGDRLRLWGRLETPPAWEDFDYRDYLALKNIHSYMRTTRAERLSRGGGSAWKRTLLSLKWRAQDTVARILPEPEASLLTGILLGVEGGIPRDLDEDFKATGASHVIAISGYNFTIITSFLMVILNRVVRNRWLAAAISIASVVIYTILVGAAAAVVRAAAMGIIAILGRALQRPGWPLNMLVLATIAMTALNPWVLWDVGFQLSAAATLGLIVYAPPFEQIAKELRERWLSAEWADWIVAWINEALLLTLAAQIFTLPLILWHFGRLSVVSLLVNFLILPVQSVVMGFGGAATLLGLAFEPLGRVVGWGAYLALSWTIRVVQWAAHLPYASVGLPLSDAVIVLVYVLLGGMTALIFLTPERRRELWQGLRAQLPLKVTLGGPFLVTLVAWLAIFQFPDGKLHLTFLDVGQGDAVFIETPAGCQILIDGGPEGSRLLSKLGRQMPFWDRTLDLVVLTHPDEDHLSGLVPVLERYEVRAVLFRPPPLENDLTAAWEAALEAEGATLIRGETGGRLALGDGVELEILHPGPELIQGSDADTNNNSVVLRLIYKEVSVLLTGDIENEVERTLVRSGVDLRSTVLKLPHHGSQTSSSQIFLDAVNPQVAVISVGRGNRFQHPSEQVLARLEGIPVLRTDQDGTVTIASDGHKLWVDAEKR